MEIKRKVVNDFRKISDCTRKNWNYSAVTTAKDKWNSVKSTCCGKGAITVREYLKNTEHSRFKPKNMILCLTIRKVILSKIEKLKKYSFSLLRCLYKELKIISSPIKKKKVFRSASTSIKHTFKQNYLKKSQENMIIEIFKRNKKKITINKLFFIWNKELHRKLDKRKQSGIHLIDKLKALLSNVLKISLLSIKKSSSTIINLQKFLMVTRTILKQKIFRELFKRKNLNNKIEVKQFKILFTPSGVYPVLINKNLEGNAKNRRKIWKISVKRMGNFNKGLWILNSCKGICRPLLRKGFRSLRDYARKIRLNIQVGVVKILFQFFDDRQVSDKKLIFKMIALYAKKKFAFKMFCKSFQKSANILSHFFSVHKTKAKIFAFTKIFLQFSYTQRLRNVKKGFDQVADALKLKLVDRLYFGMISIQTYTPKREIYKINLKKSPWACKNLQKFCKFYQLTLKKEAFFELHARFMLEKLEDFCLILDKILSKQKFKKKLEILTYIKQRQSIYDKKKFLNCMKFNYMLKKLYLKKIAYAFM